MATVELSSGELGGLFGVGESLLSADLPYDAILPCTTGVGSITLKKYGNTPFVSVGLTTEATLGFASMIGVRDAATTLFPDGIYVFASARPDNKAVSMGFNFLPEVPLIVGRAIDADEDRDWPAIGFIEYPDWASSAERTRAFKALTTANVSLYAGAYAVDIATRAARGF